MAKENPCLTAKRPEQKECVVLALSGKILCRNNRATSNPTTANHEGVLCVI